MIELIKEKLWEVSILHMFYANPTEPLMKHFKTIPKTKELPVT
jgi:hypothetical protein